MYFNINFTAIYESATNTVRSIYIYTYICTYMCCVYYIHVHGAHVPKCTHSKYVLLVYVIGWVAVVFGINCASNAGKKL